MYQTTPNDYLASRVLSADPLSLVSLLFEGLQDSVQTARSALMGGDIASRSRAITKGIEILGELSVTLSREANSTLTVELGRLYEYMIWKLTQANIEQAEAPLVEVERLAASLAEAWRELASGGIAVDPAAYESGGAAVHVSCLG